MKKIIIVTKLLLLGVLVSGQSINNSKLTSMCSEEGYNSTVNCIQGWNASHGNPTVNGTSEENTWAWMWSHSNLGEGIVTNYDFQTGKTYRISFKIKTSSNVSKPNNVVLNSTANVRSVSGIKSTSSNVIPNIPLTSEVIWSEPIAGTINNWTTINVNFTPSNNNTQLWFYPLMTADANANGGARVQMEIDDVVVTPAGKEVKSEGIDNNINLLSSNPIKKGEFMRVSANTKEVKEITILDLSGNSKNLSFAKIDNSTMEFLIDNNFKDGIYTISILNKDDTIISKKIIVN